MTYWPDPRDVWKAGASINYIRSCCGGHKLKSFKSNIMFLSSSKSICQKGLTLIKMSLSKNYLSLVELNSLENCKKINNTTFSKISSPKKALKTTHKTAQKTAQKITLKRAPNNALKTTKILQKKMLQSSYAHMIGWRAKLSWALGCLNSNWFGTPKSLLIANFGSSKSLC